MKIQALSTLKTEQVKENKSRNEQVKTHSTTKPEIKKHSITIKKIDNKNVRKASPVSKKPPSRNIALPQKCNSARKPYEYSALKNYNCKTTKHVDEKPKKITQKSNKTEENKVMSKACELINQKSYNNAILILKKVLQINPKSSEAYCQIGYCYNELKNYTRALSSFAQSLSIKENPYSFYFKGITYFNMKLFQESIDSFNNAINLKSDDADYFFSRAECKKKYKQYEQAIEDYATAFTLDNLLVKVCRLYSQLHRKPNALCASIK